MTISIAAVLTGAAVLSFPRAAARERAPVPRAETNLVASVKQGFNFERDRQEMVGHITALSIGGTDLKSDFEVTNPTDLTKTVKVFGVASGIQWKGGYSDPITFSAQVSTANKSALLTLMHKTLSNTEVKFAFVFYAYDHKAKKYYEAFHSDGVMLDGLVFKRGAELAMQLALDASAEVPSPKNYAFSLSVMPQEKAMTVKLALSDNEEISKRWGVEIAK